MDKLSFLGLIIGIAAIFGGQLLEGGSIDALLNLSAFIIVFGGSFGAAMMQSHFATFKQAMKIFHWIFVPPKFPIRDSIEQIKQWSDVVRKKGLLGLENRIDDDMTDFLKKGLNMLVDGNNAETIRNTMYIEIDVKDKSLMKAAKVYESMGGYSPTLGIVGAVLGLIHVMGNLSDPNLLGDGIATAFVATIYGVGFANLFFIPVYHKLRAVIASQSQYREMLVEGLSCIAEGQNPFVIEGKLNGYISH
ncbi:MAG: flagellar motor protein [Gammaproteobacteria bacterium]|nr:flagellar motor protein [Gammaproteobacteria bacterium]MDH5630516.1 flagellar motor protein [Gammaproteobacteria bacterium]